MDGPARRGGGDPTHASREWLVAEVAQLSFGFGVTEATDAGVDGGVTDTSLDVGADVRTDAGSGDFDCWVDEIVDTMPSGSATFLLPYPSDLLEDGEGNLVRRADLYSCCRSRQPCIACSCREARWLATS